MVKKALTRYSKRSFVEGDKWNRECLKIVADSERD